MVTPAMKRAAEAMEDSAMRLIGHDLGTTSRDRIALDTIKAFWDNEEVARALFVSDSEQPLAFALRIWDEARDDSPVKRFFRTQAMKIRTLLLGDS